MKRGIFAAALLLMASALWGENYSGRIIDQRDAGVGFATVVLVELDYIETSAEDGSFAFKDISPGTYSLLVIAPGFLEWEGSFAFGDDELRIELSPEVVEMDAIVVTADEGRPEDILDNEVSKEDLARLPARSDPFDAIPQESGILADIGRSFVTSSGPGGGTDGPPEGPVTISIEGGSIGRLSSNLRNGVSVYGGESDWNNYFYDYIRIPTNTHAFGYPEPDAIVPVEAVDEISVYKGVIPVEHGPAIGGLFALEPDSGSDGFEFTFTPSVMDISLLARGSIAPDVDPLP